MVGAIWQFDGPRNAARAAAFGSLSSLDAMTSNHQAPEASVTLDFALSPELADLRERATKVAAEGVAEYGVHHDCWINGFSREFSQRLAAEGWIGMTWPVEHGGGGRPEIERLVVAEAMISAGAPIAASWFVDRQMGPTMFKFGTPDQQQRFLPGMLRGDETWSIGMSEPDAGSDLASVATSLVRDGDVYVVNGQKIWTSFASDADYVYLIARTSREGPPHQGLSELIVPRNLPGIDIRPVTDMIGNRHFCEVFFNNVRVPAANLVGVEGAHLPRPWVNSNTSAAVSTVWCPTVRCSTLPWPTPTSTTRWCARRWRPSRPATASGGCWCTGRRWVRRRRGQLP